MVELKTSREIDVLREAGRVVAEALAAVRERAAVGVTLTELDQVAAKVIKRARATPAFLGYHPSWAPTPFPGVICASVNEAVVHGVPERTRLADGDLVSIDCGAFVHGWCGDAAISFIVGTPRPGDTELIAATNAALERGIAAALPGNRLGDLGDAIGTQPGSPDTAFSNTTGVMGSDGRCTRIRSYRTKAERVAATGSGRAW